MHSFHGKMYLPDFNANCSNLPIVTRRKRKCCIECGEKYYAKGLCHKHYQQQRNAQRHVPTDRT